jgi:hypothetical protein
MAGYHLAIDAKLRELREGTTRESVRRRWDAEAARLSSGDG